MMPPQFNVDAALGRINRVDKLIFDSVLHGINDFEHSLRLSIRNQPVDKIKSHISCIQPNGALTIITRKSLSITNIKDAERPYGGVVTSEYFEQRIRSNASGSCFSINIIKCVEAGRKTY